MDKKVKGLTQLVIAIDQKGQGAYQDLLKHLPSQYELVFTTFDKILEDDFKDKVDLLVFTGGADVNPSVYGEEVGKFTQTNDNRDKLCMLTFDKFYNVPKLGICRGSQFLTAYSGGKLIQHVEGHAIGTTHEVTVESVKLGRYPSTQVTSTHHQMMYPFNLYKDDYELIAWSTKFLSNIYLNGKNEQMELVSNFVEPEIVFYKESKSLAIQGHPEFANAPNNFKNLTIKLIKYYLI